MSQKPFTVLLFLLAISLNCLAGPNKKERIGLYDLTCEYLQNPKGIDEPQPRLGWKLRALSKELYAQKQQAYRVIVASSNELLEKNKGDVWDSKWVYSSQTNQVVYQGQALLSDRTYYWKVCIKDERSQVSAWSEPNSFTTGFFDQKEWKAQWIGDDQRFMPGKADCNIWDPWMKQTFTLKESAGRAFMYVASVGYHELYINGTKVGNGILAPAVTDHTKRARYIAYDITSFVHKGENIAGLWLGASWSIFGPYHLENDDRPLTPIVSAQAFFYRKDDPSQADTPFETLLTNQDWTTKKSPNKLLGVWDFSNMGGELWDDRRLDNDWNLLTDASDGWKPVEVYHPKLFVSAQVVEENRLLTPVKPINVEHRADGTFRVDFGTNFAGWTEIPVSGQPGDTIRFNFSERKEMETTFNIRSSFIIGKTGKGVFRNRFNYSSGRWLTIKGLKEAPKLDLMKGWLVRTNYKSAANFKCSDTLMNWIYDKVRWTFENLSLGGYVVDCPQRERMGYGGDAHATSETGMYNYQLGAFYTKWMQDWRDVQGTEPMVGNMYDNKTARKTVTSGRLLNNGILPHTAPTYWGGGGPAWGGIVVSLPWYVYEYYGDKKILKENYQLMKNWLSFLDTQVENDLLKRFGGQWDFLGDWLWPNATAEGMNNDKPQTLFFNNCYRVYNLRTAQKVAEVLGNDKDAQDWERKANAAAGAIHRKFFNPANHTYSDGSVANLAMALLSEMVPAGLRAKVMQSLEHDILVKSKGNISAGITGGTVLFKLLRQEHRDDLIFTMLSKTNYPGWGYMKENDATTIWEMWEKNLPGHSLLHSSFLFPGAWFIDGLAGIRSDGPGFANIIIQQPNMGKNKLDWVTAGYDGPSGLIETHWRHSTGSLHLKLTVPPNTTAIVKIKVEENMQISPTKGRIQKLSNEDGYQVYELQSGSYSF
ncbi:family 78 glycoside hydrolase catalytic domain [Niabella sp. CJ426]|uniref:family 78 glycoside hydrolase catalytic domain n=1 Tax=Niabella sp. CJ426 TaxID=3393740 RepID=UPI003D08AD2C